MSRTREGSTRLAVVAGIVFAAAVAVYANTFGAGFVFDDIQNIVTNRWIRDPRYLGEIFTSHAAGFDARFATSYYRPLLHVAYLATHLVFGLRPWAFHLINVVLHAASSVAVCLLTVRLLDRTQVRSRREAGNEGNTNALALAAGISGLVFATHPIHTEAVAWLAGVTDLSFTTLCLFAFFAYVRAGPELARNHVVSALLFFLATLCKEPAFALVPLLLAYEFLFRRSSPGDTAAGPWKRLSPVLIATGVSLAIRVAVLGGFAPSGRNLGLGPGDQVLNAIALFGQYLGKLALPVRLNALYVFRPVLSVFEPRVLLAIAAAGSVAILAWWMRRHREVVLSIAMIVFPLFPVLYLPALGEGVFAERYLYLPSAGLSLLCGWIWLRVWAAGPIPRRLAALAAVLVLAAFIPATVARNRVWRDGLSLWSDVVAKSPGSAAARDYLGYALYERGRFAEALAEYRKALSLDPKRLDTRANVALLLALTGRLEEAIDEYRAVLATEPYHAEARCGLGEVYRSLGRIREAMEEYRTALERNPTLPNAHNGLGACFAALGRGREAVASFAEAARLDPSNPIYQDNLARARSQFGF